MELTLDRLPTYERLGTVAIEPVIAAILAPKIKKIPLFEQQVAVTSLRLQTFATKGVVCVSCGLHATHFAVERNRVLAPKSYHLNLYGVRDGEEVLFTRDHILARAHGGADELKNLTTMCSPCNNRKGCSLPESVDHAASTCDNTKALEYLG